MSASVVGLVLLAVVGSGAIHARQGATKAVGRQDEPLLVGAAAIYTALGDADATATNTFLTSGDEPPARRQQYLTDLNTAGARLAAVAPKAGASPATAKALAVITSDLPTYSGLVEAARANNRLGNPVGAAYLREGSTLMQGEILPAVRQLFQVEASGLTHATNSGLSALDIVGVGAMGGLALALLIGGQIFLARRTNRVLNPALLAATLLVVVLLVWTMVGFAKSAAALRRARSQGSDPVQLLASTRILLSRAQSDENLALVARGSGTQYLADFDAVTGALRGPSGGGLLVEAQQAAPTVNLLDPYTAYLQAHRAVVTAANSGPFTQAVAVATGTRATDELPAATQLDTALANALTDAQRVFDRQAAAARADLSFLAFGLIVLVILAAALAVGGFEQRINEYR